jgi:hypothetical protein
MRARKATTPELTEVSFPPPHIEPLGQLGVSLNGAGNDTNQDIE